MASRKSIKYPRSIKASTENIAYARERARIAADELWEFQSFTNDPDVYEELSDSDIQTLDTARVILLRFARA